MRKTLLFLLLFAANLAFAQLKDDFSDGNFSVGPVWEGTTTYFQVIDGVLTSNGPQASSTLYLSTANSLATDAAWEFLVNLAFDPSTTNYPRIYLTSNQQDLLATTGKKAYYLQLGTGTNAENFSLVYQNGTTLTTLLSLPDKVRNPTSSVNVRVRVERSANGRWAIYTDFTGGRNFTYDGGVIDNSYTGSAYFGVYCKYSTTSRYNMFKFDDFKVEPYLDTTAPKLTNAVVLSPTSVQVYFSEPIPETQILDVNNYSINNGIGKPSHIQLSGTGGNSAILTLTNAIAASKENVLTVSNLTDYVGLTIDPTANSATILLPGTIAPNDILISEVLFNERTGGAEFVEIYNPTNKILDLKELQISNANFTGTNDKKAISATSLFIKPQTYWVLSRNPEAVKQQYEVKYPQQMVQVASLPTYTNTAGSVKLWKVDELIDDLSYTEKMHHALLKEVKGVSLERVSFTKSANEPGNLQSAAASAGFATPTYKNSQSEDTSVKNAMAVANKTFSPDNDGFEDMLQIDYRFKENGNLATINIYTDKGILVRKLARNITMSTQGSIYWDGLNDAGQLCKVGIYIVRTTVFNINGNSDSFKQTCVLASKLN
ncbi:lamin tail domain-containing protein [Pedobacter sp. UBA4863]|uniref:lamin tail domain-containing protein n=1 Tax=Pedobacter sp. UBA4863 TaxID=1947060 RepID=UPI0025EE0B32|nr:lamin tail domain-containing protein [Pedobacter sp. UBA4863]